jgi:LysR family transcriptional regulator for metE and metH
LVIELVAAGQGIGILPGWVAAPYTRSGRVASVRLTRAPRPHTWYAAWRRADTPAHIDTFVDLLRDHFADQPLPTAV